MNGTMIGEPGIPLQLPVDCTLYVYALFCLFRAQYIKLALSHAMHLNPQLKSALKLMASDCIVLNAPLCHRIQAHSTRMLACFLHQVEK